MKQHKLIFNSLVLFFILPIFILSCNIKSSQTVKISVLTNDRASKEIKIIIYDMLTLADSILSERQIDSTGKAALEFNLTQPTFAYIDFGKYGSSLYLEPSNDLKITVDTIQSPKILFTGNGAVPNNFLYQTAAIRKSYESKGGKYFSYLYPNDLILRLDSLEHDYANYHSTNQNSKSLPENTRELLTLKNNIGVIAIKEECLMVHYLDSSYISQCPKQLLNISNEIPFDQKPIKYRLLDYVLALRGNLGLLKRNVTRYNRNHEANFPKILSDSIEQNKKYTKGDKELLNAMILIDEVELTPTIDSLFNAFKHNYPGSLYLPHLQENRNSRLALLPGKDAPDFSGKTMDGKTLSLKDLKGKIIYVDVWATWCAPCRAEFPFSKHLAKQFKDNNEVVFLYSSIDDLSKKDKWVKMVNENKDLLGIQILQQDENMEKAYLMRGVPHYILIDQDGKIVNADAPRPSSGKVENEIRKLLRKERPSDSIKPKP